MLSKAATWENMKSKEYFNLYYAKKIALALQLLLLFIFDLARTPIKTHKGDAKMAFVCKETAVFVVCINNIGQQQWCFNRLLAIFLTL